MEIKNLPKRKDIKKEPESPIEWKLASWFRRYGMFPELQYEIPPYRADFAIPELKIVIEADGKEYHSTEDQQAYDKKRDSFMEKIGWSVLRFTGRQIMQEPWTVVKRVLSQCYDGRYVPPIDTIEENDFSFFEDERAIRTTAKYNQYWQVRSNQNEAWRKARDFLDGLKD